MEENTKTNNNKKAIIITAVSIIAVLILGFGIGIGAYFLVNRNDNTAQATAEIVSNEEKAKKEQEELEKQKQAELEEQKRQEELAKQQQEEEEKRLEEEAKKQEEEAKRKAEEEAKKKEEEKNKEKKEEKTTVVSAPANNGKPYYIKVNKTANTVTVYGKDANGNYTVPVRAMVCSTGAATPTSGVYKTPNKARWGVLIGPVWGQYCTRITGQILFHSVPYVKQNDPSSLEYWEYDRLGTQRSMGCIRLTVADAKWLYDNCPLGTSVEFYCSSNPGPLGKPGVAKVSGAGDPYRGWDPTDPNPNNPWHKKAQLEAEAKKKAEEEAKKKAEQEAAAKKAAEEAAAKKKADEEAKKKAEEEAKKKAEEEATKTKVVVPNVLGKSESEARNLLKDLSVSVKYNENATNNDGLVSHQSITSSSKVDKGTTIVITVNKVKPKPTNTANTTNTSNNNNSGNSGNTTNTNNTTNTTNTTNGENTTKP